jgi:tripartite-type tricarboxylate transporter receptor subunit TctC
MNTFARIVSLFAVFLASSFATAEEYPSRVIKLVVPYPPGGVVDITGRLLADQLSKQLGGTVIVENKPGAGGTIGAATVARAEPDGYTILLSGAATHAFAPWMYKDLPYDPVKDFVAVTQVTEGPLALCVNSASEAKDLAGLLKLLREKGDAANYSANGNGTYPHLSVELLKQKTGLKPLHVSYKGGGQAITALLAKEVHFSQNHIPIVLGHVKADRLRCVATTGNARSSTFPDLPTLKEAGFDVVASAWFGLFAPAGTPRPIVERLYAATLKAVEKSDLKAKFAAQGDEVVVEGPDKFLAYQTSELAKWKDVIAGAGLKAK